MSSAGTKTAPKNVLKKKNNFNFHFALKAPVFRIVNLEGSHGGHQSKKICEDVPSEKCVPVPVKVEGQQCVNIPTQTCQEHFIHRGSRGNIGENRNGQVE